MHSSDQPSGERAARWYVALPVVTAMLVLFLTPMPWRHWLAAALAGGSVFLHYLTDRAHERNAMASALFWGGGLVLLYLWLILPRGVLASFNELRYLGDEGPMSFVWFAVATAFFGGMQLQLRKLLRWTWRVWREGVR